MFGLGLAAAIAGGVGMTVGVVLIVEGSDSCWGVFCSPERHRDKSLGSAGAAVTLTSLGAITIGVPLALIGGKKVNVNPTASGGAVSVVF
jgi:hypothetical protein